MGRKELLSPEDGENSRHLANGADLVPDDLLPYGRCATFTREKRVRSRTCESLLATASSLSWSCAVNGPLKILNASER